MLFDEPIGVRTPDVIFDNGMPESTAKAMLKVAEKMNLTSEHWDNGDGTCAIRVYTGTSETSDLFWKRTERLEKIQKVGAFLESTIRYIQGERSLG